MKSIWKRTAALFGALAFCVMGTELPETTQQSASATGSAVVEYLDRGISAINTGSGMMVSWRFNADDSDATTFRLYRDNTLIYTSEPGMATSYLDKGGSAGSRYRVDTIVGGAVISSDDCKLISGTSYFEIKMDVPAGGSDYWYMPSDTSTGDVDGDGTYELFIKWDPSNAKDNSHSGYTGNVYIDCYRLTGEKLWRVDLGKNIRAGAHYTQFLVADFDLDGRAEMTCKTADGTVDGTGKVIGDASKDYRNAGGYILDGPEYYTLFDGATGAALDTVLYEYPRGDVSKWGDSYGNRCDRYLGTVMYCDGVKPSAVSVRGYYTRMTVVAYDVVDKKLVKRWGYDTGNDYTKPGFGNGNHNGMPADVDGDGKQELVLGATCIDDNGSVLWCNYLGHGDAMHLSDFLPDRPGQELWVCHEHVPYGASLIDASNGKTIFHYDHSKDTGRACAGNIWAGNSTAEFWSAQSGSVYDGSGNVTGIKRPGINFMIYWDGDLEREIMGGLDIVDCKPDKSLETIFFAYNDGCETNNSTKATPCLSADLFGDWREEVMYRTADNTAIRIYTTPHSTSTRLTTLMHDVQYRTQVATEQSGYNQPPHPSFFLGTGFDLPARPEVVINGNATGPSFDPTADYTNTDSQLIYTAGSALGTGTELQISDTGLVSGVSYTITNKHSGKVIDLTGQNTSENTNIQQWAKSGGMQQEWRIVSEADGYCRIMSMAEESMCIAVESESADNGLNVALQKYTGTDNQLWKLVKVGGYYGIVSKCSGDKAGLDVFEWSTEDGGNINQWEFWEGDCQLWSLQTVNPMVTSGSYTVRNLHSGLFMTDKEGNTVQGAAQDLTFTRLNDGTYTIENEAGLALTIEDGSARNGANIHFTEKTGDDAQRFTINGNGDGSYTILTVVSGSKSCVDLFGESMEDGATICQWGFHGGVGQRFVLEPAVEEIPEPTEPVTEPATPAPTDAPTASPTEPVTDTDTVPTPDATEPVEVRYGDTDVNGEVEILDVITLSKALLGGDGLSAQGQKNADVDRNGAVNSTDSLSIMKFLVHLVDALPIK